MMWKNGMYPFGMVAGKRLGVSSESKIAFLLLVAAALIFPFGDALAGSDSSGKPMEWGNMTMQLLGGLALFLFGMEQMSDALKAVAGERMKHILATLTTNRVTGALTGAFVTAIIQSSSVTTVLVVGFVSAGLMTFAQTLGVIFGANIGTTITAQIVAFKVTKLALGMVAAGFGMSLLGKRENIKQYGFMLMGLGLVFFGMSVMSDAMKPLRSYQPFLDLMINMENPVIGILISAAFTGLIQSSSATTGIVIVMASQGFVTLPAGIALAFGANVGTCVTALLASIGKPREAVRAALAHILFNVAGVVIWVGFIDQLAAFVTAMSPSTPGLTGMAKLADETPRQIANAHTVFNVVNTLIFLPFVNQFAAVCEKLLPAKVAAPGKEEEVAVRPLYLDDILVTTPSLALDASRRELKGMGMRVNLMLNDVLPTVLHGDLKELKAIEQRDSEVDEMHANLVHYLGKISQGNLTVAQTKELMAMISVVNSLENVGDIIETNMVYLGEQRLTKGVQVSEGTEKSIAAFHKLISDGLELAVKAFLEDNKLATKQVRTLEEEVDKLMDKASEHHMQRLTADAPGRLEAYRVEMDLMEKLMRVFSFALAIVREAEKVAHEQHLARMAG